MPLDIKNQIDVLKTAFDVGAKQVKQLGDELNSRKYETLSVEDKKKSLRTEGCMLYLKNFWSQYNFLLEKLENEKTENIHYYISFLRTLTDLYGELLFFLNEPINIYPGIFVGNYLLHYADNYRYLVQTPEFEQEYERFWLLAKDVLDSEGIILPEKITDLSHKFLKRNGYTFPSYVDIFAKDYFAEVSKETFSHWSKDSAASFYDKYYRTYSSYTHRGFTNQTGAVVGTETFWVTQFMFLIALLMMELTNLKFFDNAYRTEYENFVKNAKPALDEMNKKWDTERKVAKT